MIGAIGNILKANWGLTSAAVGAGAMHFSDSMMHGGAKSGTQAGALAMMGIGLLAGPSQLGKMIGLGNVGKLAAGYGVYKGSGIAADVMDRAGAGGFYSGALRVGGTVAGLGLGFSGVGGAIGTSIRRGVKGVGPLGAKAPIQYSKRPRRMSEWHKADTARRHAARPAPYSGFQQRLVGIGNRIESFTSGRSMLGLGGKIGRGAGKIGGGLAVGIGKSIALPFTMGGAFIKHAGNPLKPGMFGKLGGSMGSVMFGAGLYGTVGAYSIAATQPDVLSATRANGDGTWQVSGAPSRPNEIGFLDAFNPGRWPLAMRGAIGGPISPGQGFAGAGTQYYEPTTGRGPRRSGMNPYADNTAGLVQAMHRSR